ncbi:hypothetical protein A1Q2_00642 [Trichosporon asahii var. asahii CBS 8904]|uniref:Uncharacterized protein n=2 Tax=Trichosporon asahii var. asahii TaxID=189963 RepID=K1VLI0_TRIAC|nr:hypothetical protein A1Q1_03658 [Trichosporon asahii var. asahii CBS 2479]EJT52526.1 hypothetical protein A1Q1_03658 [Trichosporon asahii var. asahii CBS 2479]EKD05035.1 hypothetical protein A1Q2_00642 [Trichosporon asahii var. asahii CBS 8904]
MSGAMEEGSYTAQTTHSHSPGLVAKTRLATDAPYADLHARDEASGRGTRLLRNVRRVPEHPENPEDPEDPEDGDADHPGAMPTLDCDTASPLARWLVLRSPQRRSPPTA